MIMPWLTLFTVCLLLAQIYFGHGVPASADRASSKKDSYFTACSKDWFSFGKMCYKLGGTKQVGGLSWEKARQACNKQNGDLATVDSMELQDFLTAYLLMDAESNVWIGLHDRENETDFKWTDGTSVDFLNFEPMEPSGFARDEEDCFEMVFLSKEGKPGQWNDIHCNNELQFICQKRPEEKTTLLDPRYCTTERGFGWRFDKSCFEVFFENQTWAEAERTCAEKYKGHLATIDYRVNEFLKYVLRDVTKPLWIGIKIKEETQQTWSSGWLVSFENWKKTDKYTKGTCVVRNPDGSWQITSCKQRVSFICEYSTAIPPALKPFAKDSYCPKNPEGWRDFGGDLCYFFDMHSQIPWIDANFYCMRRGGSLVSIHSQEELNVLSEFVRYNPGYRVFIGLHRLEKYEDGFAWADGSTLDFTHWDTGEPNQKEEQCTEMRTDNMKWNDRLCSERRGYICSVQKISHNSTVTLSLNKESCKNYITLNTLLGVIVCVVFVSLLIGLVLYHFKICDRGYHRVKKLSGTRPLTSKDDKKPKYRSEIVITDDTESENLARIE